MFDFSTFNFLNVGPKLSYLGILGQKAKKLLYYGILHQHPQIFPNTKFRPKIKILKFGTKNCSYWVFWTAISKTNVVFEISILEFVNIQSFTQKQKSVGIFRLQFNKNYYQVLNQHPRICETINFHPKRKKIKLVPKKLCLGLVCNQRPPICLIPKFCAKVRILKFGTKNALFECFGWQF